MAGSASDGSLLPWTNIELQAMLEELIAHGTELAKVDYKQSIDVSTAEQNSELLKDLTAIANTYDPGHYRDYGLLIYGVSAKAILGVTGLAEDPDKLQNHVEQLLKTYISPMPQVYSLGFTTTDRKKWGVLVLPPRDQKPHMFMREYTCRDPKLVRRRGEWFVRKGATTERGGPEELAFITQRQTRALLAPLEESLRVVQDRTARLQQQYDAALIDIIKDHRRAAVPVDAVEAAASSHDPKPALGDLPTRLRQALRRPAHTFADEFLAEARALHAYLTGAESGLAWAPQSNNLDYAKDVVARVEGKTLTLQKAVATAIINDHEGDYSNAIVQAVSILARAPEPPGGMTFNSIGEAVRLYPLGLLLYTVFVCGVAASRADLLRQVMRIPIRHTRSRTTSRMTDLHEWWAPARGLFNAALGEAKCEPIIERARQSIRDHIGEMLPAATEGEYFFRGEFALALMRIDQGIHRNLEDDARVPSPGLYLYFYEASDVITDFIMERSEWLETVYTSPLEQILQHFQMNAIRASARECFGRAALGLKPTDVYREAVAIRSGGRTEPGGDGSDRDR